MFRTRQGFWEGKSALAFYLKHYVHTRQTPRCFPQARSQSFNFIFFRKAWGEMVRVRGENKKKKSTTKISQLLSINTWKQRAVANSHQLFLSICCRRGRQCWKLKVLFDFYGFCLRVREFSHKGTPGLQPWQSPGCLLSCFTQKTGILGIPWLIHCWDSAAHPRAAPCAPRAEQFCCAAPFPSPAVPHSAVGARSHWHRLATGKAQMKYSSCSPPLAPKFPLMEEN